MTASATVRWLGLGEEVGSARKVGQWRAPTGAAPAAAYAAITCADRGGTT